MFAAIELLGIDKAPFCDLRRGREGRVSLGKLIRMLANANRDAEIAVVNTGPSASRGYGSPDSRKSAMNPILATPNNHLVQDTRVLISGVAPTPVCERRFNPI